MAHFRRTMLLAIAATFMTAPLLAQDQPSEPQAPPAEPPVETQPAPRAEPERTTPPAPTFTLLEAGQEPRRELRYELPESATQELTLVMQMSSRVSMDGAEMPANELPPLELRLSINAAPADGGAYEIRGELVEAKLRKEEGNEEAEMFAQMLNQALSEMAGLKTVTRMDKRGIIRSSRIEPPEGLSPQFAMMAKEMENPMTQTGIHLPEEAVGEGAKWRVQVPMENQGVTIQQTIEYELTSLDGDIAEVQMKLTQSAEGQKMDAAELKSMSGEGTGSARVNLRRPAALQSQAEMTSRLELVLAESREQEVVQTVTMKSSLASQDKK